MAGFLFYLFLGILLPLAAGAVAGLIYFLFYSKIRTRLMRNKYSKFKNDPKFKEQLKDGYSGKAEEKEVAENEQRRTEKFREFEKLRKLAGANPIRKGKDSGAGKHDSLLRGEAEDGGRSIVQADIVIPSYKDSQPTGKDGQPARKPVKRISLD